MPPPLLPKRYARRGAFSLIEAAIVLGIIGLVIGGIWAAASEVSTRRKQAEFIEGLLFMTSTISQIWPKNIALPTPGNSPGLGVYNGLAISAKAVPENWISSDTVIRDPWGNAVNIDFGAAYWGASYNVWIIEFSSVTQTDCYALANKIDAISNKIISFTAVGEVGDPGSAIIGGSTNCSYYSPTKLIFGLK